MSATQMSPHYQRNLRGSEASDWRRMDAARQPRARAGDQSGHRRMHRRCCRMPRKPISIARSTPPSKAYPVWRGMSPQDRGKILKRAADLMHERAEHIARIATIEEGKTIHEARMETHFSADILEWFAEEGPPGVWTRASATNAGCSDDRATRAGGSGGRLRAVEFSGRQSVPQARCGARRGVSMHHEAGRADPGFGARSSARVDGRRVAERRDVDRVRRAV